MAHYIDKDALVAEIEKGINGRNDWQLDEYRKGYHDALIMLKKYLSTLEVKEVVEEPYVMGKTGKFTTTTK